MALDKDRVEFIFNEALVGTAAERAAFLDRACAGDVELRQRVESLLAAHDSGEDFLVFPSDAVTANTLPSGPSVIQEGPGTVIGRYKLLEQIGEGGFGVVFMAEQEHPVRRRVALKIIKLGMDTRQVVARFEAERQALAIMDHPNIARVLDGGTTDTGRPYFVMQLVKGIPITSYCNQNNLSPEKRLELFIMVCQAVQHAHQKGIIHRDLKPSNVLVAMHDDKPVPVVIDFGIAKATQARLTEKTLFTEFRQMIGTPAYMSPEQAQMNQLDIDTRSDVYSLGVLLYELLTGATPFDTKDLLHAAYGEMQRIIREKEPPKPSTRFISLADDTRSAVARQRRCEPMQLCRLIQGDLDWIVMKCLEKERTRRYETASGLANDIRRHLTFEPVSARAPSAVYRVGRLIRRHRALFAMAAAIALALLLGVAVSTWQAVRANRARNAAQAAEQAQERLRLEADASRDMAQRARDSETAQRLVAQAALLESNRKRADVLIAKGDAQISAGRPVDAANAYEEASAILRSLNAPTYAADFGLWDACRHTAPALMSFAAPAASPVQAVAMTPDGRIALSGSRNGTLELWDLAKGRDLGPLGAHLGEVIAVAISGDGRLAISGSGDNGPVIDRKLKLWNLLDRKLIFESATQPGLITSVVFTRDGRKALVGSEDASVQLWDLERRRVETSYTADHHYGVWAVAFSPDQRKVLSADRGGQLNLWDFGNGSDSRGIQCGHREAHAISYTDQSNVLVGNGDGTLQMGDVERDSQFWTSPQRLGAVRTVAVSGATAVCGGDDRTVALWNLNGRQEIGQLGYHAAAVRCLAFGPGARTVLSGGDDGMIKLWGLSGREARPIGRHESPVLHVAVSPDGRMALSAGREDCTLSLWDISTGHELRRMRDSGWVIRADFAPDGRTALVSSYGDGPGFRTVKLWDVATAEVLHTFVNYNDGCFSPDGSMLCLGDQDDGRLTLVEMSSLREMQLGIIHHLGRARFSPGGTSIVAAAGNNLEQWNISQRMRTAVLAGHTQAVSDLCFSTDGKTVLSSSEDCTLRLWDLSTGMAQRVLAGHCAGVSGAAIFPDGRTAISSSSDNTLKLWDLGSGMELRTLRGHTDYVATVALSRDGGLGVSGGWDGTVMAWDFAGAARYPEMEMKVDAVRRSLQADPDDARSLAVLGEWYACRGVWDWAAECLDRARSGGAVVSSLMLGRCYWNLSRFSDAGREFHLALAGSHDPDERFYLGLCIRAIDASAEVARSATRPSSAH